MSTTQILLITIGVLCILAGAGIAGMAAGAIDQATREDTDAGDTHAGLPSVLPPNSHAEPSPKPERDAIKALARANRAPLKPSYDGRARAPRV